jgi:hypothetical protein
MAILSYMERQLLERLGVDGKVTFVYRKSDFSRRVAHGTRNLRYVPAHQRPKQEEAPSDSVITYYDLDKKEWRSFRIGNLLEIR